MQDSLSKLADSLFASVLGKCEDGSSALPSFTYKGVPFSPEKWQQEIKQLDSTEASDRYAVTYLSPDNLLRLKLFYTIYNEYPVIEWLPFLEANGDADTGIVDSFRSLDLAIPLPELVERKLYPSHKIRIRRNWGAKTRLDDFSPQNVVMTNRYPANHLAMETDEGRSSTAWLPFFAIDLDDFFGVNVGIGWSGAWSAAFDLTDTCMKVNAGMMHTHFRLHPGESIHQPSIFVLLRDGMSVEDGQNLHRRFMLDFHSPHNGDGSLKQPPYAVAVWGGQPNSTVLSYLETMRERKTTYNVLWMDAGWYGPDRPVAISEYVAGSDWYRTVGDWRVNQVPHPGGLKPITDKAHELGMKFMLWVEMERIVANSPIAKEHPDWVLKNPASPDNLMLNLGIPEARQYAINTVAQLVEQEGVDYYREDFNFNILPFCRAADTEERQGITEAKFIGGFYEFWDALLKRFPDMMIDNCASGGRRIDFETSTRSICMFRSDIIGRPWIDTSEQQLSQLCWLSHWVPMFGGSVAVENGDDYKVLAAVSPGLSYGCGYAPAELDATWEQRIAETVQKMQSLFYGDFYAITEPSEDFNRFLAYQLHDAAKGSGFFAVFRPQGEASKELEIALHGISPRATYKLTPMNGKPVELKGSELAKRIIKLPKARSCQVAFYEKVGR